MEAAESGRMLLRRISLRTSPSRRSAGGLAEARLDAAAVICAAAAASTFSPAVAFPDKVDKLKT